MDPKPPQIRVAGDTPIATSPIARATTELPRVVQDILDERIEAMQKAGHGRVSRSSVLAALIISAPDEPDALYEMIRKYRAATVREVLPASPSGEVTLRAVRKAGRPR